MTYEKYNTLEDMCEKCWMGGVETTFISPFVGHCQYPLIVYNW
jgi:hypothetical protein